MARLESADEFLNITQVAERLGVRERVIQSFVDSGSIPHRKIGKAIRFRWADVLVWWDKLPGDMTLKKHSAKFMDRYSATNRTEEPPSDTFEKPLKLTRGPRTNISADSANEARR
jgi:excisionase family DNA binding protein